MLSYLKWLSVAGVWLPITKLAAWAGISWVVGALAPDAGWGIVVIGMTLTFALSHALAVSSLIGAGLLLTRRAPSPAFTLLSVTVGGLVSALVLSRIYFDFTTSSCLQSLCSIR
jgi:hypothetical protein